MIRVWASSGECLDKKNLKGLTYQSHSPMITLTSGSWIMRHGKSAALIRLKMLKSRSVHLRRVLKCYRVGNIPAFWQRSAIDPEYEFEQISKSTNSELVIFLIQ